MDWKHLFHNPNRFMRYDGQFLYPPRAEHRIQPQSVGDFDNGQYIGQPKFDGSNTAVAISETTVVAKERHNTFFAIPPKFDFKALHRGKGHMCITGEFMNKSKLDGSGQPFKGFCIWDITAFDGLILIGSTPEERIELLKLLYPPLFGAVSYGGIDYMYKTDVPGIYRANNFYAYFSDIYETLSKIDMIEGFMLNRKNGKLEMMSREQNNTGWVLKVRKPTQNYLFKDGGTVSGYQKDDIEEKFRRKSEIKWNFRHPVAWKTYYDIWEELTITGRKVWLNTFREHIDKHVLLDENEIEKIVHTDYRTADVGLLDKAQVVAWMIFMNYGYGKKDIEKYNKTKLVKPEVFRDGGTIGVGTHVGMMRGEHKGEKGYIKEVDTTYKVKIGNEIVDAHEGDFYNDND